MKLILLDKIPQESVSHDPAIKKRVMLHQGDVPHLAMFSQARFPPGQVTTGHRHKKLVEVFFVQSGRGAIRINGESHQLEPGVCVVVEPDENHEIQNTGSSELVLIYFGINE